MSVKYILQPNGKVLKVDNGEDIEPGDVSTEHNEGELSVKLQDDVSSFYFTQTSYLFGRLSNGQNDVIGEKSNLSHTFENLIDSEQKSPLKTHKAYNFFTEADDKRQFANSFEVDRLGVDSIVTEGGQSLIDAADAFVLWFDYLIGATTYILARDTLNGLMNLFTGGVIPPRSENNYAKGKYEQDFDELTDGEFVINEIVYRLTIENFDKITGLKPTRSGNNILSFAVGLFLHFIPTKLDISPDFEPLTDLVDALVDALITGSQNRHQIEFIKRKIIQQESHRSENKGENGYYNNDDFLPLRTFNSFYYRFIAERIAVGDKYVSYSITGLSPSGKKSDRTTVLNPLTRLGKSRLGAFSNARLLEGFTLEDGTEIPERILTSTEFRENVQSTSVRLLPHTLVLPDTFVKGLVTANKSREIEISSANSSFIKTKVRRLSKEFVKAVEDRLENEYMPFYVHDLRTNEIIAFHAFIDSITDAFNPQYNSVSGYGRVEDIKTYQKTDRNINLTFTLASTSKEDHDLMWFIINKLVAMCYPQWSEPITLMNAEGDKKEIGQPFTQIPTASPMIRLRVGDVIKSNYSKINAARLMGLGKDFPDELDDLNIASNDRLYDKVYTNSNVETSTDIDKPEFPSFLPEEPDLAKHISVQVMPGIYRVTDDPKDSTDFLALFGINTNSYFNLSKTAKGFLFTKSGSMKENVFVPDVNFGMNDFFVVAIKNNDSIETNIKNTDDKIKFLIVPRDKLVILETQKSNQPDNALDGVYNAYKSKIDAEASGPEEGTIQINNPVTKAFESSMGRGLAGFITQLDLGYQDSTWETSTIGAKAPQFVKITLNFAPIHDIPLGLDADGMIRAPAYNVGSINNQFFGDPHDKNYVGDGVNNANNLNNSYMKKFNDVE